MLPCVRVECPICHKVCDVPEDFGPRPFCSKRCKQIDLMNWLEERYCLSRPLTAEELGDDDSQSS
jgi:hypothetical protein